MTLCPCSPVLMAALLLAATPLMAAAPAGDAPGALDLAKAPQALLSNRLSMRLPAGMRLEPRRASIMAAPEATEDETRLILDRGPARLVVMVYELYTKAGEDLRAAAEVDVRAAWKDKAGLCKLEPLAVEPPLRAVSLTPPPVEGTREANLVLAVYTRRSDGLVQYLAFYLNPEGMKQAAAWTALGRRMAGTLSQGPRELGLAAGERRLTWPGGGDLVLQVPQDVIVSPQQGPDFVVYHLRPISALGAAGSHCGVYFGNHPSFQHRQLGLPAEQVKTEAAPFLGSSTDWQVWERDGRWMVEAIRPHPGSAGVLVHAFCNAPEAAGLKPLRDVLASLRPAGPKK